MEALKISSFRNDYNTLSKRLLAVNGFNATNSCNPHNVKAYVIHNEFGAICCAIGSHLGEALDNAVDNDCLDSCLVSGDNIKNYDFENNPCEYAFLGNASEPFDLEYIGVLIEVSLND